ncbi:DUF4123 domain-containing protein [Pseudomonas sp. SIMBA_077]
MFEDKGSLSERFPPDINWQGFNGLLLDAVRLIKLSHSLEQWDQPWLFEPLYTPQRMPGLEELSPRVLKIESPQQPVLQQFLAKAEEEWGYLLFCDGAWPSMIAHLRWLTVVRMPHEQNVFLRLADPSVMHALFTLAVEAGDPTLFGPCHQILIADAAQDVWHLHQRPGPAPTAYHGTHYQLSTQEASALDIVSFRNVVLRLGQHLQHYFPAYQIHLSTAQRWAHLHALATTAYDSGFSSELEITLYANIHGYLGENALQQHPDLQQHLSIASPLTSAQRIEKVADIARCRALQLREPT